ncbi:2-succinyl-5-enolpyruvyl-6-hydroxy-3-cyclohexene-1-carboxylate synthase [Ruminococcus sp. YE71]|uniref:2-succinyl-5-enolpyruvyl-6-hydroxy-3- cyclohexene-1-carboxylate synthase n=1 Tax=unclassified Ruminococcus TaxID=2608920 RepID=UPI000882B007|nr:MULTISPECIES: thiamine pyrophosphate-binding protein [unclassified Ruminococcus]SDA11353.1 2-succinyl-5-enolpyruvyl-6-hydroxy-3-cyclohexene-1-carboxylate synthase [Ruminococcus sp. YE78]SFW15134.1 2-succinyl-5-enolpyruvyl-6-hydroxy-3-cyclohexene-1-carboxylate synthase [Ruminococcus sp. YE71]
MNSSIRSVQIIIDLMKQYNIKNVILSPGGSDIPLIHAIETDSFFSCYSVVDERSAVYFALGMAQIKKTAVACVCTSGTAVCNYLPGITEAFYQDVPILAITADKNPYYQGQLETQKIEQRNIFDGVIKKSVSLPLINNSEDEWLCNRLINEALLELYHHGKGPVHINIPIVGRTDLYNEEEINKERKINIYNSISNFENNNIFNSLINKKIMVIVGQNVDINNNLITELESFFSKTNCIFAVEHLSNLKCRGCVNTYPISEISGPDALSHVLPDVVISIGNNLAAYGLKPFLRDNYRKIENWLINESGVIRDTYKSLTSIFEMPINEFFSLANKYLPERCNESEKYYLLWQELLSTIRIPDFEFSNLYVARALSKVIPKNSIAHLAILNSTRIMQFFNIADNVKTFSNVGALGIDGCVSTFAGMAASTDELCYLVIGDLSFFYDMNAAGLRSISPNVRIILLNNGGGSEFHFFIGKDKISSINEYISAEHFNVAAGWAISLGYEYYYASDKDSFDSVINKFGVKSEKPLFLEVITDMESDAKITKKFYSDNAIKSKKSIVKGIIKKVVSDKTIEKTRSILKTIR